MHIPKILSRSHTLHWGRLWGQSARNLTKLKRAAIVETIVGKMMFNPSEDDVNTTKTMVILLWRSRILDLLIKPSHAPRSTRSMRCNVTMSPRDCLSTFAV